ncbi:MAG: flagellar biosynthesis protein FlgG [Sulfurimonas sp.]|nr:MAG: flagellar biosynthesis protein FlgG [Sulfurimonas sp.]
MQTGYYNAAAGMVAQFNRLDNIANNLANINTAGFKEDNLIIGDFMRIFKEARDKLPHENNSEAGAQFFNRALTRAPQIVEQYTNFSLGSMQKTNNQTDFALSREGLFFAVKTPQGIRLTRDGSFTTNDEGTLVTKQGYEVLPSSYFASGGNISFNTEEVTITSDKNGQMYTNLPNSVRMGISSKMLIVQPENINLLQKEGDNLFIYNGSSPLESIGESGAVMQGFIEKSNVNAVRMMTQMIETNRLVGMYQKVMNAQMDDMNNDLINKIARKV